jgi:hypothetical protein
LGPTVESVKRTIEDGGTGPHKAVVASDSSLATHSVYRPDDLSSFGEDAKLPILAWGNGGCANSSTGHQNFLSEIASHGFLVVAIGPTTEGGRGGGGGGGGGGTTSAQLIEAIDWAIAQHANEQGIYFGKIDTSKIAVAGMSCGGLQALEVSTDPRVSTTMVCNSGILNTSAGGGGAAPRGGAGPRGRGARRGAAAPAESQAAQQAEEPAQAAEGAAEQAEVPAQPPARGARRGGFPGGPGGAAGPGRRGGGGGGMPGMPAVNKDLIAELHAPVLYLLGGSSDIAYENGMDDFRRIEELPAFVANMDVGHGGTYSQPHGGEFAKVATAWLQWQLKGDEEAAKMFVGEDFSLKDSEVWTVEKKNIP